MALEPSAELREVFLRWYQAVDQADAAAVFDPLSHEDGVPGISADPNEWWTDYVMQERACMAPSRKED